jgi:hypothetical protein
LLCFLIVILIIEYDERNAERLPGGVASFDFNRTERAT